MNSAKKIPSPLVSLFPIAFLIGMLFATIHTFGSDALSGGSQISLLATTGMCVFIGMAFYRIPWKDYELAITNNISGVATAIIILLIIGALSGIMDDKWGGYLPLYIMVCKLSIRISSLLLPALFVHWYQ